MAGNPREHFHQSHIARLHERLATIKADHLAMQAMVAERLAKAASSTATATSSTPNPTTENGVNTP